MGITSSLKSLFNRRDEANPYASDVILASFPKSGNSWMRFLLGNIVLKHAGLSQWRITPFNSHWFIPAVGKMANDRTLWPQYYPRILKTHRRFRADFLSTVLILRHPVDVYWSYYAYALGRKLMDGDTSFSEFIKTKRFAPCNWVDHAESYLDAASRGSKVCVILYEEVKADPKSVLDYILRHWGLSVREEDIEYGISCASAGTMTADEDISARTRFVDYGSFRFVLGSSKVRIVENDAAVLQVWEECRELAAGFGYGIEMEEPAERGGTHVRTVWKEAESIAR